MDFISWSVFGILFVLAESAIGSRYLLAIGLAFIYPALADLFGASANAQYIALALGSAAHMIVVRLWRKRKAGEIAEQAPSDIGQRVEVIEWNEEGSARVRYLGREWQADKAAGEMPNANHGIIRAVQYGRLIIDTTA